MQYLRDLIRIRSLEKQQLPIRADCKDLEKFLWKDMQIVETVELLKLLKQKSFFQ